MKAFFYSLTLVTLLVSKTYGGEFWISPVGTDNTGSGTAASPWIRSSQASFDALMSSNAIPTNSTIHLMAGTFLTHGTIILQSGCKLRGAGIDVTTIQLINNLTPYLTPWGTIQTTNSIIFAIGNGGNSGGSVYEYDGVEVSDMTIDCNLQNQTAPVTLAAVELRGAETKISRIKAINWGGTGTAECFIFLIDPGFWLWNASTNCHNCLIEDCVVEQPANVTHVAEADGFVISGFPENDLVPLPINAGWIYGAEIRDCRIHDIPTVSGGGMGAPNGINGIGINNSYGAKIDGNVIININGSGTCDCVISTCGSLVNASIENNMFLDVANGIYFGGADNCLTNPGTGSPNSNMKENIVCDNNFITVQSGGVGLNIWGFEGINMTNVTVKNNTVQAADGAGSITAMNLNYSANATVQNNTLDANGGTALDVWPNVGVFNIANNLNLAGVPGPMMGVPSLNQELETSFIPTQAGWYRIATSQGNFMSGTVLVDQPAISFGGLGYLTSVEFTFDIPFYANAGNITLLKNLPYGGNQAVNQIRISNDPFSGALPEYVDIHVGAYDGVTPITVRFRDTVNLQQPLTTTYLGTGPDTTNQYAVVMNLAYPSSFQTAGAIVSGTNNIQLTSQGGAVLNSALSTNISVGNLNGGVGASSNTFWRGDGTWTTPASPMTVKKTADQSSTSTTLVAVTNLSFSASANTDYAFEYFVVFQSSSTANGISLAVNAPTGATLTYLVTPQVLNNPNQNNDFQNQTFDVANGILTTTSIDTANTNRVALVKGSVSIGSTAGTVNLMFGSGVSSKTTTIKKGSWGTFF